MKLVKIGNSLRVTIPMEVCDALKLAEGDTLAITVVDGEIRIRKSKKD